MANIKNRLFYLALACGFAASCSAETNSVSNPYGFAQELEEASEAQFFSDISEYGIEEPSYLSEGILRAANESNADVFRNQLRYSERLSNNLVATRAANGGSFSTLAELDGVPNTGTEFLLRLMIYAQRNNLIGRCGEGLRQARLEQCDDGNTNSSDGCSVTCQTESSTCVPDCSGRSCGVDPRCGTRCGSCDGTCTEAGVCMMVEENGPRILSINSNVQSISVDNYGRFSLDRLVVTAIVSDADGLTDIAGGDLLNPSSGLAYGTFQRGAQGTAYELSVGETRLREVVSNFENPSAESFVIQNLRARFFDQGGHTATADLAIRFVAAGYDSSRPNDPQRPSLCGGRAVDAWSSTYLLDADGDLFPVFGSDLRACSAPTPAHKTYRQILDSGPFCPETTASLPLCTIDPGDTIASILPEGFDCNDAKRFVYPTRDEVADGVDNNCDGVIDTDSIWAFVNESGLVPLPQAPGTSVAAALTYAGELTRGHVAGELVGDSDVVCLMMGYSSGATCYSAECTALSARLDSAERSVHCDAETRTCEANRATDTRGSARVYRCVR